MQHMIWQHTIPKGPFAGLTYTDYEIKKSRYMISKIIILQ